MLPCRHDLERDELELRLGAQVELLFSSGNSIFDATGDSTDSDTGGTSVAPYPESCIVQRLEEHHYT